MFKKILVLAVTAFNVCGYANTEATTSTTLSTIQQGYFDGLSLSLDLYQSSNLKDESQGDAKRSTNLEVFLTKELQSKNKVSLHTEVSKDNTGFGDTTVSNTLVIFSLKSKQLDRDNKVTYSLRALLPTNEEDREDDSLRGGVSARAFLTSEQQAFKKPLTIKSYLDGMKYVHSFQTKADGAENVDYRVRLLGSGTFEATKKLSVTLTGYYQAGQTYQGVLKAGFYIEEELQFEPKKDGPKFYIAHTNNGNALEANGKDSNVAVFDENSSTFSAGVRASF